MANMYSVRKVAVTTTKKSQALAQALRQGRSSRWCPFPAPEPLKPFPVPPNEGIGFDIPQSITPGEHLAESRHDPPRGIAGPARLSLSLLKQCQLLPEEQILRCERAPSPATDGDKPNEVEQNQYCCGEAMPESDNRLTCAGMKGSASHVSRRYAVVDNVARNVCGAQDCRAPAFRFATHPDIV